MLKKCLALLVLIVTLIGILPVGAAAQSEEDAIKQEIRRINSRVMYATGRTSLHGFCGLMSSYQLYFLGVNKSLIVYDGKDQFDAYKNLEYTTGGNRVKVYYAKDYDLCQALYTVSNGGTQNVYNILVGFQWTHTEAGSRYGHAMVINAIIDGIVYYSEGYPTASAPTPGQPSVCTIDQFAAAYSSWTVFEGLVVFGKKQYTDFCDVYSSNAFLEATGELQTVSQPSSTQGQTLRTVRAGERLRATAVYQNEQQELYYQIQDSGITAYVKAQDVAIDRMQYDDIRLLDAQLPETLQSGEAFSLKGKLVSAQNKMDSVTVEVVDEVGRTACSYTQKVNGRYIDLGTKAVNDSLLFCYLPDGNYTLKISAEVGNHQVEDGALTMLTSKVTVLNVPFTIGQSFAALPADYTVREVKQGWVYEDSVWRYYEQNMCRTGWFCSKGVDYYLLPDGAAATGWQEINGKMRFFTDTGAMCTGWLEQDGKTYYLLSNGVMAVGERTVDGVAYFFTEQGILVQ